VTAPDSGDLVYSHTTGPDDIVDDDDMDEDDDAGDGED